MKARLRLSCASLLFFTCLMCGFSSVSAEQVWTTNKTTGCRFSIPVHSKDVKIAELTWNGPCKNNLAEGEGPVEIKFYLLPNDKTLVTVVGMMTMANGQPQGKASLRWSYDLTFEGEYAGGERSKGSLRYEGESYEGGFLQDKFHGRGTYRYKNGEVYEGDFVDGKRQGTGVLKGTDGKIKYEGDWANNHPVDDPAATRVLKSFINISWGTSRTDAEKALKNRPGNYLSAHPFISGVYRGSGKSPDSTQYTYVLGTFNNEPVFLWAYYYEDKFFLGKVNFFNTEQDILVNFDTVKKDLIQRYGAPTRESGKFMDSTVVWEFLEGNFVALKIDRLGYDKQNFTFNANHAALRDIVKRPFNISLSYGYGPVYKKLSTAAAVTTKTDY